MEKMCLTVPSGAQLLRFHVDLGSLRARIDLKTPLLTNYILIQLVKSLAFPCKCVGAIRNVATPVVEPAHVNKLNGKKNLGLLRSVSMIKSDRSTGAFRELHGNVVHA